MKKTLDRVNDGGDYQRNASYEQEHYVLMSMNNLLYCFDLRSLMKLTMYFVTCLVIISKTPKRSQRWMGLPRGSRGSVRLDD